MMHEILKPYFNKYTLSNNILQEGCDKAKVDLFGDLEENIQYASAIAKAIEEMGHTVDLIFTNRPKTLNTVNAPVLKEEMDRKKADKQSMTRQEKVEYVNNWKKENNIFLCDTLGLEDGPQYKYGYLHSPSTSKKQVPFLQEVLQADAAHMSFGNYTLYSVNVTTANGTMSALRFAMLFGIKGKESWSHFWKFIKKTHSTINSLTAKSILTGEKLVLFGTYVLNFYVGIVHYILHETKTWRAKIYLPTQRTNWQILTSAKIDTILTLYSRH
jgi:hypothetical protein